MVRDGTVDVRKHVLNLQIRGDNICLPIAELCEAEIQQGAKFVAQLPTFVRQERELEVVALAKLCVFVNRVNRDANNLSSQFLVLGVVFLEILCFNGAARSEVTLI